MAAFVLPANVKFLKRGKPVVRIHLPSNGTVVTLREDGVVNFWTPKLYLKSKKNVFVGYIYILFVYVSCILVPALLYLFNCMNPIFHLSHFFFSISSLREMSFENQNGLQILCQCQSTTN